jgi:hypothetical protein
MLRFNATGTCGDDFEELCKDAIEFCKRNICCLDLDFNGVIVFIYPRTKESDIPELFAQYKKDLDIKFKKENITNDTKSQ